MPNTTIQISTETKKKLDNLKEYRRETYNDVIMRLIKETNPPAQTQPTKAKKEEKTTKTPTPTSETSLGEETEY